MSFLTSLDVRVMDDCSPSPKFMTLEPFHYHSEIVGTVVVPRFYTFDMSVPQAMMSITGLPGLRAACVHDYLIDSKVERRTAAKVFKEALQECGIDESTVDLMYQGVRMYDRFLGEENGSEPVPPEPPVTA